MRLKQAIAHSLDRNFGPVSHLGHKWRLICHRASGLAFKNSDDGVSLGMPYYGQFIPDLTMRPRLKWSLMIH